MESKLRATASTRHSITVSWNPWGPTPGSAQEVRASEAKGSTQFNPESRRFFRMGSEASSPEGAPRSKESGERPIYVLQMNDRIFGWITVYSGYGTKTEVKNLKPGECFRFRLKTSKDGEESDWSECLIAATEEEAVPLGQLLRAVQNANAASIKKIISRRPSILNVPNKFSQTPLEVAISNDDVNTVALLLNSGADLTRTEIGSWRTPLMIAAFHGRLEMVKLLAGKRCSWDDRDRNGMTALHYAADNSHLEIVKFAIEDGAPIDARDVFGWSPLMRAVTLKASREVVEYLLENGGDANETDGRGQTLLMQAVLSGRVDAVKLVASKMIDYSSRNAFGRTARHMAASSAVEEIRNMVNLLGDEEDQGDPAVTKKPTLGRRSQEDLFGSRRSPTLPFPARGGSGPLVSGDHF